jgi:hypothetical protein
VPEEQRRGGGSSNRAGQRCVNVSIVGGSSAGAIVLHARQRGWTAGGQIHDKGASPLKEGEGVHEEGGFTLRAQAQTWRGAAHGKARAFAGAAPHDNARGARAQMLPLPIPRQAPVPGCWHVSQLKRVGHHIGHTRGRHERRARGNATVPRASVLQCRAGRAESGRGRE